MCHIMKQLDIRWLCILVCTTISIGSQCFYFDSHGQIVFLPGFSFTRGEDFTTFVVLTAHADTNTYELLQMKMLIFVARSLFIVTPNAFKRFPIVFEPQLFISQGHYITPRYWDSLALATNFIEYNFSNINNSARRTFMLHVLQCSFWCPTVKRERSSRRLLQLVQLVIVVDLNWWLQSNIRRCAAILHRMVA